MAFQDIRRSRKFLSATDIGFVLGALIFVLVLLAVNIYVARTFQGGEWLFLRWSGTRAFLHEQIEPYGSTVAQRVQTLVYGHEAFLDEYPFALNDPFYILLLYTPLAMLKELISIFSSTLGSSVDFNVAHGIWMLLSEAALIGIVLLSLQLSEWKPPRWMLIILIMFGLFSAFSVNALLSASPTIFLTLIYLSILVALRSFSDELAGVLLFLIAYQWEVGALFFLFVLIFVIVNRRWNVFIGFGMTLMVLLLISLISKSDWLMLYIRAVLFNWNRGINYNFGITLSYFFPMAGLSIGGWLAVIAGIIFLYEIIRSLNEHFVHVVWAALLALTINPMMGFAIFPSNHIVLLPALILIVSLVWERWTKNRVVVSVLLLSLVLIFSFSLYFQTLFAPERLYSDLLRILPPVLATTGLYWMRWWAVRPPRIWADQFGIRK